MMAVGAFNQVQSSLRWFIDNFSAIADWRATLLRVASFPPRRDRPPTCCTTVEKAHRGRSMSPPGAFSVENLKIASPGGCTMLERAEGGDRRAGERVLIAGESGTGKTLLFRALAGLWPSGRRATSAAPRAGRSTTCRARPTCRRHASRGHGLSPEGRQLQARRLHRSLSSPASARAPDALLETAGCWTATSARTTSSPRLAR